MKKKLSTLIKIAQISLDTKRVDHALLMQRQQNIDLRFEELDTQTQEHLWESEGLSFGPLFLLYCAQADEEKRSLRLQKKQLAPQIEKSRQELQSLWSEKKKIEKYREKSQEKENKKHKKHLDKVQDNMTVMRYMR